MIIFSKIAKNIQLLEKIRPLTVWSLITVDLKTQTYYMTYNKSYMIHIW